MAENPKSTRLYSEKELGKLIQRATELQQEKTDTQERGLSLAEVERIAAEIGLAPQHLRTAALEMEHSFGVAEKTGFRLNPFPIDASRVLQGTLTDTQWEEIVLSLRRLTGSSGKTNEIGKTREWSQAFDQAMGYTRVSISPRDEQSTVNLQINHRGYMFMAFFLALFVGGALTGIMLDGAGLSNPVSVFLFAIGCVGSLVAARAGIGVWARRQKEKLKQIMQIVSARLSGSESGYTLNNVEKEGRIELPDAFSEAEKAGIQEGSRVKS